MKRTRRQWLLISLTFIICHLSFSAARAQSELWITGSAVPGGIQKLTVAPGHSFKYAGELDAGELRIQTTKKVGKDTRYYAPALPDANIANRGTAFTETADATTAAWQVSFGSANYRFTVDARGKSLRGEVFHPWGELFIAGGATEVGWKCEGKMLLMTQDLENPCVWTWEGELRNRPQFEEPRSFKFQGQDRWGPKALHPYTQGADILTDGQLRTGGDDTKWTISREGRYRITVDVFHETVKAELIASEK